MLLENYNLVLGW